MNNVDTQKHQSASEVLEKFEEAGYDVEAPVDVDEVARYLGLKVIWDSSLENKNIVGEINFSEEGVGKVNINPSANSFEPRRRFTLAHEIGHWCLHRNKEKSGFVDSSESMSRKDSYWDHMEFEANNFAAQLLMPRDLVLREGKKIICDFKSENGQDSKIKKENFIEGMARKFEVSKPAMEYRLKNMGII